MCKYSFITWEWIEVKLYVQWKYLLFFINALTAFLLCMTDNKSCLLELRGMVVRYSYAFSPGPSRGSRSCRWDFGKSTTGL